MIVRFLSLLLLLVISDIIVYSGSRRMFFNRGSKALKRFTIIYWSLTVAFVLYFILHGVITGIPVNNPAAYRSYFVVFAVFVLLYVPKFFTAVSILTDDLIHLCYYIMARMIRPGQKKTFSAFFKPYRMLSYAGFGAGVLMFFITLYGITTGKTNFKVKEVTIRSAELPGAFDGFRIAQISDIHLGSFYNPESVIKGIDLLNKQHPDMIVMTGDMINASPEEANPYIDYFRKLQAAAGKFAVLGNHDMGDYLKWDTTNLQNEPVKALVTAETKMGFTVLRNTHQVVRRGNDSIVIAGVDNWGLPPFKQYGRLDAALPGTGTNAFTILLSHDPSHWRSEVLGKTKVNITLSGHTHAFQLGIDCGALRWSPIFLKYREYLGLYEQGGQHLYVNPGFGFLGFAGRIGTPPEITIITLRKNIAE